MTDNDDLSYAAHVLELGGLQVEPVPTGAAPRCDLRATDAGERYLVEVKACHDDKAIGKILRDDDVYERSRSFNESAAIKNKIQDAVRQLQETLDPLRPELRLICLVNRSRYDGELISSQIRGVLYGVRCLVGSGAAGNAIRHECLYFAESAFYKYRDGVDAAMIIDAVGVSLWLNDHSVRADRVRGSGLAQFFAGRAAFNDEGTLEKRGWLVARCSFDRRMDEEKVRRHVEKTYELGRTFVVPFKQHSAMVSIPDPR